MENIEAKADLLNLSLHLSSSPAISFLNSETGVPANTTFNNSNFPNGFGVDVEAALPYDALSKAVNGFMTGKRFQISEGLIAQHIVVQQCRLYAATTDYLMIEVSFTGSFRGKLYLQGKPHYHPSTRRIELENLQYDLQTTSFLLRTANWLFDNRIIGEIKKYASIDLSTYFQSAATTVESWLNRTWAKGISGSGTITRLELTSVHALPQHLLIRSHCTGQLSITIAALDL